MKRNYFQSATVLVGGITVAMFANHVSGAIVVNDTFDVGASPTIGDDVVDAFDIAWNASATASLGTTGSPGSGNFLSVNNANVAQATGALPSSGLILSSVGDKLIFSGVVNFAGSGNLTTANASGVTFRLLNTAGRGASLNAGTGGNTSLTVSNRNVTTNSGDSGTTGTLTSTIVQK